MTVELDAGVPLLHDTLIEAARHTPDRVALVCKQERVTYRELDTRSNALARALCRRGVRRGDRVVVFGDNSVETAVAFWAVLKASAVASIVNPTTKGDKLRYLLNDCGAAALITEAHLANVFGPAAGACPTLVTCVVSGQAKAEVLAPLLADLPGGVTWDEALAGEDGATPPARQCLDLDLASIIYTSGSTGEPKGVMLTHRNMMAAATSVSAYLGIVPDDVLLQVLPMAFGYGLYQMILAFRVGARVVLEKSFAFPAAVLKVMVSEGVTGFAGVPTIFATLADMPSLGTFDLSRLRFVTNAAAHLPVPLLRRLRALLPQAQLFSMYGQTECKRISYVPPAEVDRKPDSVGIAIPNTELWIVDDRDRRLPVGQVGQLVVRGATVMRGYWGKPEATAQKLRPGPLPGETVLYTGDLCRFDEDGYLYVVGRMDDIIKSRGEKVAPSEVERALRGIRGVKDAAVIGVPDPALGQAVKAFVVLEAGASLTEKDVHREALGRLEPFMVPKTVVFVAALPRLPNGKLDKQALAAPT
jgi:amino acid adenylation domain-containing protein